MNAAPGLLESAYEGASARELSLRGISHVRQKSLPVQYKGASIDIGFRLDLLVENRLVVEMKAVEKLLPLFIAVSLIL